MKAMLVKGSRSKLAGVACRQCHLKIIEGDSVLYHALDPTGYAEARFVVHTACMASLVESAPVPRPQAAYEELRELILETGNPFPTRPEVAAKPRRRHRRSTVRGVPSSEVWPDAYNWSPEGSPP